MKMDWTFQQDDENLQINSNKKDQRKSFSKIPLKLWAKTLKHSGTETIFMDRFSVCVMRIRGWCCLLPVVYLTFPTKYTDTHPDTFNKLAVSFSHDVIAKYSYYCVFCNGRQSVCGLVIEQQLLGNAKKMQKAHPR